MELAAFVDQLQPRPRKRPDRLCKGRRWTIGILIRGGKTEIPVQVITKYFGKIKRDWTYAYTKATPSTNVRCLSDPSCFCSTRGTNHRRLGCSCFGPVR